MGQGYSPLLVLFRDKYGAKSMSQEHFPITHKVKNWNLPPTTKGKIDPSAQKTHRYGKDLVHSVPMKKCLRHFSL